MAREVNEEPERVTARPALPVGSDKLWAPNQKKFHDQDNSVLALSLPGAGAEAISPGVQFYRQKLHQKLPEQSDHRCHAEHTIIFGLHLTESHPALCKASEWFSNCSWTKV